MATEQLAVLFADVCDSTTIYESIGDNRALTLITQVLSRLNEKVQAGDGTLIKTLGDGVVCSFRDADAAFHAACRMQEAVAALSEARAGRGEPPLRIGLALHVGDVAYGNIGGQRRLDFTCIGPAVNVASRLEGLTTRLGRPVVVSAAFAALTKRPMAALGTFELKGVAAPQAVFGPEEGHPLSAW